MTDHIEAKREEARKHKGVWYDVRADKFAAEVYSRGARHFVGHFATAEEASAAYAAARAEMPSGRDPAGSFAQAFQTFLSEAKRDGKGDPVAGSIMTYQDQKFTFEGVAFRRMGGKRRPLYQWSSDCCVCTVPYDTITATAPGSAKGITRTCETHRRGKPKSAPSAPVEPSEHAVSIAREAAETMSLIGDKFRIGLFFRQCKALDPEVGRAELHAVIDHPNSIFGFDAGEGLLWLRRQR